jgi:hypothetical protein
MNSKERIIKAMNMETPDRVPLMCQFSIGCMMLQLQTNPYLFWHDKHEYTNGLIKLCQKFRFDGILVSLHGHSEKWKKNLKHIEKFSEGYKLHYTDRIETHTLSDLPTINFFEQRIHKDISELDVEKDIPDEITYIPVSQGLNFDLDKNSMFDVFDLLDEKVNNVSIHGEVTSPFDYFLELLGYQNGLMALLIDPEKSKQTLKKYSEGICDIAKRMCEKNIDAIKISSPFGGMGFISVEQYKEFVLPYEREIISAIKSKGKFAYIHTCGSIGDRLEIMCQSGTSGLECLDPYPLGNVDLEDAFHRVGKKIFIKGNIDAVNTMLSAEYTQAEGDVIKIIQTGKNKGKGFILSTACSIAPNATAERINMLSSLIEKYGYY